MIGIYHELGHFWADKKFPKGDDVFSESMALLTELTFGPSPCESLNTVLSFAWRSSWPVYRSSGQEVLSRFVELIKNGFMTEELKNRSLNIKESGLLKKEKI